MIGIFAETRQLVPVRDAAELYGYHPNRAGFIKCPFHMGDHTASLKLYPGLGGWHCFGCNRGGSVIDFTAQLFGLDLMGAVRRLDQDFNLHLSLERREPTPQEKAAARRRRQLVEARRLFETWREQTALQLAQAHCVGHMALMNKNPDTWTDAEITAVKWMPTLADWADALDYGDMETQMMVFRDRKGVERLCNQILNSMPEKSATA